MLGGKKGDTVKNSMQSPRGSFQVKYGLTTIMQALKDVPTNTTTKCGVAQRVCTLWETFFASPQQGDLSMLNHEGRHLPWENKEVTGQNPYSQRAASLVMRMTATPSPAAAAVSGCMTTC